MAAYNYYSSPYYPMGYQPQMQQPVIQPQIQQQVQPMQTVQNQPSIIWVANEYEVDRYPVAPNNAITLWSTSEPVVYLKQADATGKPTIKTYDLVERTQAAPAASSQQGGTNIIYAKKDDLEAVLDVIKGISNEVEQMKGDLYGVAGRKKTVRKQRDDEEADE